MGWLVLPRCETQPPLLTCPHRWLLLRALQSVWRRDMNSLAWVDRAAAAVPAGLAETHKGHALLDDRHLYLAGGQASGPAAAQEWEAT